MPRNGSGVYSKPAGTTFVANTVIESAKVNQAVDDLVSDANAARPIVAGGTGATSAASARTNLGFATTAHLYNKKGADVASASTLTLGDDGNYFDITGTTTITAIATKGVGTVVKLHFDASLTLTHHATDLILPGGANIITAAGDEAEFVEYATGDWRCTNYSRASENWVDVASATTTDIGAVASQNVRITGTTTITGLGTVAAGTFRRVRFSGALTLTHNGTSLILPGAANITTVAGDVGEFISEGSGNWRCVSFTPSSGLGLSSAGVLSLLNASGSAPVYAPRAWVNFNGTGVVAIRASGNVTSVSDNGTGDYTINFATAMDDANYAASVTCTRSVSNNTFGNIKGTATPKAVGSLAIEVNNVSLTRVDADFCDVAIFR